MTNTNSTRPVSVETVKKSIDTMAAMLLVRKVRHVCDGGRRRPTSRDTVRSETSIPSLHS